MYTFTKYDIAGNVLEQRQYNETIPAPELIEYPDLMTQLDAEEWDMRDATHPMESLRDREDWLYA